LRSYGYTAQFNLEVVWYAQEHGKIALGRKLDVDKMNVR
jgi:hypothetical protein